MPVKDSRDHSECPLKEEGKQWSQWHPYPEEKPTWDGTYNVTTKDRTVQPMTYENGDFFTVWGYATPNDYVIAWKNLDKPYKKDTNE